MLKFFYNDKGHRVRKESFVNGSLAATTYYVRDASGSTLAIYKNSTLAELPIYGTSRLGVYYKTGNRSVYQLTDHLGNVRAVITKAGNNAAISSSTDYYPGGMAMPGRQIIGGELYRYGYQGEFAETDPETGKPAFQLRIYDPRINRWLTPDPKGQYFSPYMAMDNRPNMSIDPTGGCTVGVDCPPDFDWMGEGTWVANELVLGNPGAGVRYGSDAITGGGFTNFSKYDSSVWDAIYDSFNVGSWETWDPTWRQEWGKSENIFGQISYDFANGFYTTSQMFIGRAVGDYSMRNIDGTATTTDQGIMGFIGTVSFGYGKYASSLKYVKNVQPIETGIVRMKLWNQFTKGGIKSRGYSTMQEAADAFKIRIEQVNSALSNHNGFVKTMKQSANAAGYTQNASSIFDYYINKD